MISLRQMINALYDRRDDFDGSYLWKLIGVWYEIANTKEISRSLEERLGHNSVNFIERAYSRRRLTRGPKRV